MAFALISSIVVLSVTILFDESRFPSIVGGPQNADTPSGIRIGEDNSGQFSYLWGIAINNTGHLYVIDEDNCKILVYDTDGVFLFEWGDIGNGEGQFDEPTW